MLLNFFRSIRCVFKRARTIIPLQNRNTTFNLLRCHVHTRVLIGRRIETYFRSRGIGYFKQECRRARLSRSRQSQINRPIARKRTNRQELKNPMGLD